MAEKLEDIFIANVGNLILLEANVDRKINGGDKVCGFLHDVEYKHGVPKKVRLGTGHPKNVSQSYYFISDGSRWYRLEDFDKYKVLEENK